MLEVKNLNVRDEYSSTVLSANWTKAEGEKIHELEARSIEINQTITQRIKANM